MKHHLKDDKKHQPDPHNGGKERCDECGNWTADWRMRVCGFCRKQLCHLCWNNHMHVEDYER